MRRSMFLTFSAFAVLAACSSGNSGDDGSANTNDDDALRRRHDAGAGDAGSGGAGGDAGACGFVVSTPLALAATTVSLGSTLSATVSYKNTCASAVSIKAIVIAGRPPGGTNAGGPWDDFAPEHGAGTIAAGATVTVTSSRTFAANDPIGAWYTFPTYEDAAGAWHDGQSTHFNVTAADAGGVTPPPPDAGGGGGGGGGGTPGTGLHVSGNKLLDANGAVVHFHGANRSGTEYACIQNWGIFDGPSDAASVQAMASWKINSVRVPLNEDCWLGINGVSAAYGGANYQNAIVAYVKLLHQYGIYAEVALMWAAPGATPATNNGPMPDTDHSITFWQQVATTFKSDGMTFFDLLNEPHNVDWPCWLNGGASCSLGFSVAGMQSLVNAVRSVGATNVIAVPGIDYANNLTGWLANKPSDPANQLMAEAHVYGDTTCSSTSCWNSQLLPVAQQVPLHTGELGGNYEGTDCSGNFTQAFTSWAEPLGVGYQLWTWDTWGSCDAMISNYNGTPYGNGVFYKQHLATLP